MMVGCALFFPYQNSLPLFFFFFWSEYLTYSWSQSSKKKGSWIGFHRALKLLNTPNKISTTSLRKVGHCISHSLVLSNSLPSLEPLCFSWCLSKDSLGSRCALSTASLKSDFPGSWSLGCIASCWFKKMFFKMVTVNIVHLSVRKSRVRGTRKLCATFAL